MGERDVLAADVAEWLDDRAHDGRLEDILGLWVQGKRDSQWTAEHLIDEGHIAALATLSKSAPDPEPPRDRIDEANALGYREGYRAAEAAHKVATRPAEPLPREALDVERLAIGDELLDANHEIAAFLHPFIWGNVHRHDTEPGDGSDCHECYGQAEKLRAVVVAAVAREYAALSPDWPTPP